MSKSAIKTINAALTIINKAGVSLPHLLNIQDPALRAAWRNADHLACFTVRCLADCFEAESLETIAQHEWDSMNTACQRYFESGLDLWNGKQWKETGHINAAEELERLAAMVARWVEYHDKLEHTAARARIADRRADGAGHSTRFAHRHSKNYLNHIEGRTSKAHTAPLVGHPTHEEDHIMSTLSALNRAILAGQRLQAVTDAIAAFKACYQAARGSSMPSELADVLTNTARELVRHKSALREELEAARVTAAETRVFKLGAYYLDIPAGYTVERIDTDGYRRIGVSPIGSGRYEWVVLTHETNGDDVGGFVVQMPDGMNDLLFSAEHIALKFILTELAKDGA